MLYYEKYILDTRTRGVVFDGTVAIVWMCGIDGVGWDRVFEKWKRT